MEKTMRNFNAKWVEDAETGCWNWTGALIGKGYGQFQVRPHKCKYAHRWSWRLHVGRLADGDKVLHECDNPRCVNPKHLFIGTTKDNQQDMKAKGRSLFGERNPSVRLTEAEAYRIHDLSSQGMSTYKIAAEIGISQVQVSRILRGLRWEHVFQSVQRIKHGALT